HLRSLLPAGSHYIPVDIKARSPRTVVLDFDFAAASEFPNGRVAFFSGSLEYVADIPAFVGKLIKYPLVIASYTPCYYGHLHERRGAWGWKSHYTAAEFISIFEQSGFVLME